MKNITFDIFGFFLLNSKKLITEAIMTRINHEYLLKKRHVNKTNNNVNQGQECSSISGLDFNASTGQIKWKPGFNPSGASVAQLNKNRIIPLPLDSIKGSTEHDPEYKKESKESNPRIFKEIYDRTFRSLKWDN